VRYYLTLAIGHATVKDFQGAKVEPAKELSIACTLQEYVPGRRFRSVKLVLSPAFPI